MLINEKYLKEYGIFPANYDMTEVMQYVPIAEAIWVKPVIGDDLYDDIQEQVDEDDLSEEYGTLLTTGGLWRYLAQATALEMLPLLWAHLSEVSITKGKSDNSEPLSLKDMTYIEQHLRRQVEVLKSELIKFLNDHCDAYEYYSTSDTCQCSCCADKMLGLKKPNPSYQVYKAKNKNVDIK